MLVEAQLSKIKTSKLSENQHLVTSLQIDITYFIFIQKLLSKNVVHYVLEPGSNRSTSNLWSLSLIWYFNFLHILFKCFRIFQVILDHLIMQRNFADIIYPHVYLGVNELFIIYVFYS